MSAAVQRPLRGSRLSSFYPPVQDPSLSSLDSAFQLQEYINLLIRLNPHDVDTIVAVPGKGASKETEPSTVAEADQADVDKEAKNDFTVDEACWIYEQLRRLAQDLTHPLITSLQQECTRASCPEMKAGEWLYLCVAHGNEGAMEQCCAIDYILHTLDSATALLNSPRAFPSRLSIPATSHRHFSSLARRLGRIFAHAYFHHREVFEQAEAESSLYARFLALTTRFELVPPEFLVIPPRLEGESEPEPPRLLAAAVNHPRPEPSREPSPAKMGRSRTDTMVFSEGMPLVEDIARAETTDSGSPSASLHQETTVPLFIAETTPEPEVIEPEASAEPPAVPLDTTALIESEAEQETTVAAPGISTPDYPGPPTSTPADSTSEEDLSHPADSVALKDAIPHMAEKEADADIPIQSPTLAEVPDADTLVMLAPPAQMCVPVMEETEEGWSTIATVCTISKPPPTENGNSLELGAVPEELVEEDIALADASATVREETIEVDTSKAEEPQETSSVTASESVETAPLDAVGRTATSEADVPEEADITTSEADTEEPDSIVAEAEATPETKVEEEDNVDGEATAHVEGE